MGGGKRHRKFVSVISVGEPDLVGKGLRTVLADAGLIFPTAPLDCGQRGQGHRRLPECNSTERLMQVLPM